MQRPNQTRALSRLFVLLVAIVEGSRRVSVPRSDPPTESKQKQDQSGAGDATPNRSAA